MLTRLFILFFPALLSLSCPAQNSDWMKDIDLYARSIEKKHANPFNWIPKERFLSAADSLKKISSTLNRDELMVGLLRLNASLRDEHTQIDFHYKEYYPVVFYWFDEGISVVSVLSRHADALGARLVAINDVPLDSVVALCRSLSSSNTSTGFKFEILSLLSSPFILHGLHIIPTPDSVRYTFLNKNSDTLTITLHPVDQGQGSFETLYPEKQLLRNSNRAWYWFQYDEEKKFIYVNYNKCSENSQYPFSEFLASFRKTVEARHPGKVIIDLRYNGGGSSGIFKPLIVAIANMPELKDKKIFALIGRRTYSAAVINAFQLRTTAHAILVGEETGGKLNHAGNVHSFVLKNSKATVYYSFRDYYFDATQRGGVLPDKTVAHALADYLKGIDPALDYAVEQ
jgi:hypothetical protein